MEDSSDAVGRVALVQGLVLRRADHTAAQVARSQHIRLQRLTVESFGGGRKFYYAKEPNQHIYGYGSGITVHSSSAEITDCLIQRGTGKGISVWGSGPDSSDRTVIRRNLIRDLGPHPWGGGWAHGRGTGIGTGNASNVLIADNEVQRVRNCGVWVDGGQADSNLQILDNRFSDVGNYGILLELGIADALVARNLVRGARCGFRVGPAARRCRILGNVFDDCELGGAIYVFKERVGARRDTIPGLAVAANLFLRNRQQAISITAEALENPNLLFESNLYHFAAGASPDKGFATGGRWGSFNLHQQRLRASGHCLVADEHSQLLPADASLASQEDGSLQKAVRGLLTDKVWNVLQSHQIITPAERSSLGW